MQGSVFARLHEFKTLCTIHSGTVWNDSTHHEGLVKVGSTEVKYLPGGYKTFVIRRFCCCFSICSAVNPSVYAVGGTKVDAYNTLFCNPVPQCKRSESYDLWYGEG